MLKKYTGRTYCFSPPVMLATFLIEFTLAFYTIWRYKLTTVSRLATVMLFTLGTFQLSEYMICGGLGLTNVEWARVGYASITLLPALGIHTISALAHQKNYLIVGLAYASSIFFTGFYLFFPEAIDINTCRANYAVFTSFHAIVWPYAIYYYGWLLAGTYLALNWAKKYPKYRISLYAMAIGYLSFILPTTTFNLLDPTTTNGIPSIMCGFAVIYAVTLSFRVLPYSTPVKNTFKSLLTKLRVRI